MQETHAVATEKLTAAKSEVSSLRQEAELARRTAANAPAECLAAKERIRSRDRIAQGRAKQDLQQGRYLESLVDPEYMRERAGVESGIVFWWIRTKAGETNLPLALAVAAAVVTTFAAGGLTYLASDNAMTAVMVGVVVAGGFVAYWWTRQPETPEHEQTWRYVARLFGSARRGGERATDIEGLTPFDPTRPRSNGNGRRNGSGNGRRRTRDELEAMNARAREALDGDGNGEEKEK